MLANDRMVNGKHQLEMYMERVRKDGAERVIGVYLTPRRYQPDFAELWTKQNRMTLGYDTAIKHWVENCWNLEADGFKKETIRQYGELLDVALNDPQVALEFREAVAANWEVAYDLYCSKDADRDFILLNNTDIRNFKKTNAFRLVNRECREALVKELMKKIKKELGLQDKDLTV